MVDDKLCMVEDKLCIGEDLPQPLATNPRGLAGTAADSALPKKRR